MTKGKKDGVTIKAWIGHPSYRWRVTYPDGGRRKTKGFLKRSGAGGAEEFSELARHRVKSQGSEDEQISKSERLAVMAFRELVESFPASLAKPSLGDVVDDFRKRADIRRKSMTIRELVDKYLIALTRRMLDKKYTHTTSARLERFAGDHGEWMACDVSTEVAGDWLHDIELSATTVNHFRAALVQLFSFAVKIKAVEENPILAIDKIKGIPGEVGILTLTQAADLLTHASPDILPSIAIGLFAGMRRSEISRLDWSEVNFEEGHIEVKAKNSKSAARRLIPMRSALRAWLSINCQRKGPVMPSAMIYRTRLDDARAAAGITVWPHNALRHSFASYNLAAFENANALAGEMGHGSTKMIFEHYRALVTSKTGKSYWNIMPEIEGKIESIRTAL